MAVAQSLLDAETRQNAAIAAVSAKVDALLAGQAGSMTPAEQDVLAAKLNEQAAVLEAVVTKT
jgi:hypothetical protein